MMSNNGGMDKEDVVRVYHGIYSAIKKEKNNAIFTSMDGHRDCHAE